MIETLHLFITLAERLHFRKTSEHYHLTPAALTRAIQTLEKNIGTQLFERSKRSVKLTDSGRRFYAYAKQAVLDYDQLLADLHIQDPQRLRGSIKLYATVTAAYSILPALIKRFRESYPSITTYLETGAAQGGYTRLHNGEIDFCIGIISKSQPDNVLCKKILETPLVFVVPKTKKPSTIYSLIFPEQGDLATLITMYLQKQKLSMPIHSYVEGHEAILAMVSAGLGAAILPKIVIENSHLKSAVQLKPLPKPLPNLEVGIFMKKTGLQSPIKKAFWESIS